jgi:predicted phage baseplate assembly protein
VYLPVTVAGDTTRGLAQQGVVRLELPRDPTRLGVVAGLDPDALGTGDLPPPLPGLDPRKVVLFWLRAYHRDPTHHIGRVAWVGANAAEALQRRRAGVEFLGTGNGQAGQTYRLQNAPVLERTLVVEVEDQVGGRWVRWSEVEGFEAAREDDKVFTVDLESGEVRFGNGVKGFAPQIGQRIRATEYRHGGGAEGNVGAGAVNALSSPLAGGGGDVTVANPLPARGGAPAETIAAALERIPGELRRHDRAVSAGDFRELALATPGADLGRAEVLPLYDPRTGNPAAAGVVTVVVWPREDRKSPDAPMPDRTTLRQVCAWLDRRRLVTTELHVVPPRYQKVAVSVGVRVRPGYGVDAVRSWVERVVRQYLAPLPPHGPDGKGWPLGRAVYGPEIDAAVLQVEGVELVEPPGSGVAFLDAAGRWVPGTDNTVPLTAEQLPELAEVRVVNGPRLEPGADFPPPGPVEPGGRIVPVPTIVEEC